MGARKTNSHPQAVSSAAQELFAAKWNRNARQNNKKWIYCNSMHWCHIFLCILIATLWCVKFMYACPPARSRQSPKFRHTCCCCKTQLPDTRPNFQGAEAVHCVSSGAIWCASLYTLWWVCQVNSSGELLLHAWVTAWLLIAVEGGLCCFPSFVFFSFSSRLFIYFIFFPVFSLPPSHITHLP